MKTQDRVNLDAMLRAVVANLAKVALEGNDPPQVAVSLRAARLKSTRYDRKAFSGLPNVLETLSRSHASFTLQRSRQRGLASIVTATPNFAGALGRAKFAPGDFAQTDGQETIWLSLKTRDNFGKVAHRQWVDYRETEETRRYRAEMAIINAALSKADLDFIPDGGPAVFTGQRTLRRLFNLPPDYPEDIERFDFGGRLFGGFWLDLEKSRRRALRVDGEPVADLDFSSAFIRLAYIVGAGMAPPSGDLYASVSGLSEPRWREGVKKVINAMLFRTAPLRRLPKDVVDDKLLPPGMRGSQVRAAIIEAHPALANVFETGIGFRLMFVESQIMVAALLDLAEQNIVALPIHDGILCPLSRVEIVRRAMHDASAKITGHLLPIALKLIADL